jgi:hypothetical protein
VVCALPWAPGLVTGGWSILTAIRTNVEKRNNISQFEKWLQAAISVFLRASSNEKKASRTHSRRLSICCFNLILII